MRLRNAKIVGDFHINRLRFVPRISSHIKSYSWLRHVSMKVLSERAQVTTAEKHGWKWGIIGKYLTFGTTNLCAISATFLVAVLQWITNSKITELHCSK